MVVLDPRYAELQRGLAAHRAATAPDTTRWCPCGEFRADASGLCPVCKDEVDKAGSVT